MLVILARLRALPRLETAIAILGIVVIAMATYYYNVQNARTIATYSTNDYTTGGAHAFFDLLRAEGVPAERFERLAAFLDASIGTLVWIDPLPFDSARRDPSKAEVAALERWTKAGGTFVYVGFDRAAARAHTLRLPDVTVRDGHGEPYVAPELHAAGVARVVAPGRERWIVGRPGMRVLVADARGPVAVSYRLGRGRVVAIVDREIFSNAGIVAGDDARFAVALLRGSPGPIAFDETTHGYFVPEHWWLVAPRALVVAVVLGVFALAIAVVGAAIRLGPPLVPVPRDDATTVAFIAALAGLMRAGNAPRTMLRDAAASTSRALARSFGLGDDASTQDIAAHIDRADRRAAYTTMLAIAAQGFPDDHNLVRGVALAADLRKDYAAHADRRR